MSNINVSYIFFIVPRAEANNFKTNKNVVDESHVNLELLFQSDYLDVTLRSRDEMRNCFPRENITESCCLRLSKGRVNHGLASPNFLSGARDFARISATEYYGNSSERSLFSRMFRQLEL